MEAFRHRFGALYSRKCYLPYGIVFGNPHHLSGSAVPRGRELALHSFKFVSQPITWHCLWPSENGRRRVRLPAAGILESFS